MTIVSRAGKGSPLTHTEMDNNLKETAASLGLWRTDYTFTTDQMTNYGGVIYKALGVTLNNIPSSSPGQWEVYNPAHVHGFADVSSAFKNEPTMVSNSAVHGATQASIKAYVDNSVLGLGFTIEQAQDAVYAMLVDTTSVKWTYVDATPALTANVSVSATNRLLGRYSGGAGTVQELTIGTGFSIVGSTLNATGSGSPVFATSATGPGSPYPAVTGGNSVLIGTLGGGDDINGNQYVGIASDSPTLGPGNNYPNYSVIMGNVPTFLGTGQSSIYALKCNNIEVQNCSGIVMLNVFGGKVDASAGGVLIAAKNSMVKDSNQLSITSGEATASQPNSRVYGYRPQDSIYVWPIGGGIGVEAPAGFSQVQELAPRGVSELGVTGVINLDTVLDSTGAYETNGISEARYYYGTVTAVSAFSDPVASAGAASWDLKWLVHVTAPAGGTPVTETVIGSPTITKTFSNSDATPWTVALNTVPSVLDVTGDTLQQVLFQADIKCNRVRFYEL